MKRLVFILLAGQILSGDVVAQDTRATRELLDAAYDSRHGGSRLTFTFDGPVGYAQKNVNNNRLRLTFPQTTSSKYLTQAPIVFGGGHAQSVSFDFSRSDTLTVFVSLNNNVSYDVRKADASRIMVEMHSSDTAQGMGALIDIKALARHEAEPAMMNTQSGKASSHSIFDVHAIPFAVACATSLLGTFALMSWIERRAVLKKASFPIRRATASRQQHSAVDAILAQAKLVLQEKAERVSSFSAGEDGLIDRGESALALAQKFGRGQGEFQLLKRLEAGHQPYMWEEKLRLMDPRRTPHQSAAAAKKLGVGKGELHLAASLRRVGESQIRKESRS